MSLSTDTVSAGRVGDALDGALCAAGHTIVGAHASSEAGLDCLDAMLPGVPPLSVEGVARQAGVLLSVVPNDELGSFVEGLARLGYFTAGQLTIHVTGYCGMSVLEPTVCVEALTLAIHPAMTFTGTSLDIARLIGHPFAAATSTTLLPIGQVLVTEMGGTPVIVAEGNRGLRHAAPAHDANHLVAFVAQSMRVLEAIGVEAPGAYLAPLPQAAFDGTPGSGESALTGPVMRGGVGIVCEHLTSLDALAVTGDFVDVPPAYRAFVRAAAARVVARSLREPPTIDHMPAEPDGGASGPAASD